MEIRIRSIFLASAWVIAMLPVTQVAAQSDEEDETNLIEPQIERVEFDESLIDSDDFEIAGYIGYLAIEDFDTDIICLFNRVSPCLLFSGNYPRPA